MLEFIKEMFITGVWWIAGMVALTFCNILLLEDEDDNYWFELKKSVNKWFTVAIWGSAILLSIII